MSNTFEPLNKPDSTIQDAGLYQGQVLFSSTVYCKHMGSFLESQTLTILTISNGFSCIWLPLSNSTLPYPCCSLAITFAAFLKLDYNLVFKKKLFSIKKTASKKIQQTFCKGSSSKYFWLSSSYGLCHNYNSVLVVVQK